MASTLLVKWWVELGFCRFTHTDEVVHILINNPSADIVLKLKISWEFFESSLGFYIVKINYWMTFGFCGVLWVSTGFLTLVRLLTF